MPIENKRDPSREPAMLGHYVSHYVCFGRLRIKSNPEARDSQRVQLLIKLQRLYSDQLVDNCIEYIESHPWRDESDLNNLVVFCRSLNARSKGRQHAN